MIQVIKRNGEQHALELEKIQKSLEREVEGIPYVDITKLMGVIKDNAYHGMSTKDIQDIIILGCTSLMEEAPEYDVIAARFLLKKIFKEVTNHNGKTLYEHYYRQSLIDNIVVGVERGLLSKGMLGFDLEVLAEKIVCDRDHLFRYMGLQTLYERYLLKHDDRRVELPQVFWMRIAMGLALLEPDKNDKAIEFYEVLSNLYALPSTPMLFHSGLQHSQLASCFLNYTPDDLHGIFKVFGDNAQMAKYSGGIGTDFTAVRGTGSWIKKTNVPSQGVIPFLRIQNDTTVAINRSGKRRGAAAVYLENWHLDVEDFIDLKRNTGDERRRTHDLNTALWISDLFMQRVEADADWTLFSPDEVPDLHEIYGRTFKDRYEFYEAEADAGRIKLFKRLKAKKLWQKHITTLFETGGPWVTWKDPSNVRSPQDHVGVIHNSNLCCTSGDQKVITSNGFYTVEELYNLQKPMILAGKESPVQSSVMYLPRLDAPMINILTTEGYSHKTTPDHKVLVKDRGLVEVQELKEGDQLYLQTVYGFWGKEDNVELIDTISEHYNVPEFVWKSNEETVRLYLSIFSIFPDHLGKYEFILCSANLKFIQEIQLLLLNFGYKTNIVHKDGYEFTLILSDANMFCTVKELEYLDNENAYCPTVESEDHLWTCNGILTKNTEIIENNSATETAVCSLSSINLARMVVDGNIDYVLLEKTVRSAIRWLDNSIDNMFFPTKETEASHKRHRPLGLGQMGWQDLFFQLGMDFESEETAELVDELCESISASAILASVELAKERGKYSTFERSKWSKGILPIDSIDILEEERGEPIQIDRRSRLDWDFIRSQVLEFGMANSLTCAIAPTATISNIAGSYPCIEPIYLNAYTKSNRNGEFTVINHYLVEDLRSIGLWSPEIIQKIKVGDGSIQHIKEIPVALRRKYKTCFEIDQKKLVRLTALRTKWIDQSQSHNVFFSGKSGKAISDIYFTAWKMGLKTTYYLRTLGATHIEKATTAIESKNNEQQALACAIDNPDCESCQ